MIDLYVLAVLTGTGAAVLGAAIVFKGVDVGAVLADMRRCLTL